MTEKHNGLHYDVREDGDIKISNPDTQNTLYLGREELAKFLTEIDSQRDVRPAEEALKDARQLLGLVINALQDAGLTNSQIKPVEELMTELTGFPQE